MERRKSVLLMEQENLKELFRILDGNGLDKEKDQFMELADYIDNMDQQFGRVLEELQGVRKQLDQIQEKGICQSAIKAVGKVEGMEKQTDRTTQRIDRIGEKAEEIRKPSVKENLRLLQEEGFREKKRNGAVTGGY